MAKGSTSYVARLCRCTIKGDSEKFTKKALDLDADVVCLDLEDAVAANKKEAARAQVVESLDKFDFGRSEVAVRINPLMTELCEADIEAILSGPALPQAIVVPKVETVQQMKWFFDKVSVLWSSILLQPSPRHMHLYSLLLQKHAGIAAIAVCPVPSLLPSFNPTLIRACMLAETRQTHNSLPAAA